MPHRIIDDYFNWLLELVHERRYSKMTSFERLFRHLHSTEFIFLIPKDGNRAEDGCSLRYRYAIDSGYKGDEITRILDILDGPCSVLEMMISLAIHCEENIMDDPRIGNRTAQWFREMLVSLGLGSMTDSRFDEAYVDTILTRFLNRNYESNGKGGLFTIRNCDIDLRKVEIWHQLCWYLDSIM